METLVLVIMLGVIALIIICYGTYHNKRQRAYEINQIKDSYGKPCKRTYKDGEYAHICGYYNVHVKKQELNTGEPAASYHVDDITWKDLNMDEIYHSMDYTQSSAGDEYLYYTLRCPRLEADERLRELTDHYMSEPDKRLAMSIALHDMGRTGKYSIYDYINNLDAVDDTGVRSDYILIAAYAVTLILFVVNTAVGGLALLVALLYGGISYFAKKRKIEPYIISFAYVIRLIGGAAKIAAVKDDYIEAEKRKLKGLTESFAAFGRFSGLVMSAGNGAGGDIIGIIVDYIKIFTHIDIIRFYRMRNEIIKHTGEIDELLTIIGRIDTSIAIGSYRTYLGRYCEPVFVPADDKCHVRLEAKGLYHPLLVKPVANDIRLDRGMLLTGSNASGKSTMLRTVTLAAILAQSVYTVPARDYRAPAFRIYTSLALTDDIMEGESYYMTEIRSLKRIIDAGKLKKTPILAAIDEVLRGTNTIERISASTVIMKQLSESYGLILAATHDLELTGLLNECYDNYHFEETIEDNDISFAYKLMPGAATTRNAIKLLRIMGYDEELVKKAEDMAGNYDGGDKL